MDEAAVEKWLTAYGDAWERLDADAAAELFSEDATYQWGPFEEPMRGRETIRSRWQETVAQQGEVDFEHEVLAVVDDRAIAEWRCVLTVPSADMTLEMVGIFDIALEDGSCTRFNEWWNDRQLP